MPRKRSHVTIDHPTTSTETDTKAIVDKEEINKEEQVDSKKMKGLGDVAGLLLSLPPRVAKHVENIRSMRSAGDAPVDTMGCDKLQQEHMDEKTKRYQLLLSLMMSSQTKDQVTHDAMVRLHKHGCTMKNILATPEDKLGELIKPVGMYKKKANYIHRATEILIEKFDSDIPGDFDGLCSLPGVGPKMALLALECGWGISAGIAVDTHVHRIANRLEWVDKPTKQPEQTRAKLENLFPKEMWREVNHLLVGFGQTICKPVKPMCQSCLNKTTCAVGKKETGAKVSPYFDAKND